MAVGLKSISNWSNIVENYSVLDMTGFATTIRENVASSFAEDYSENLDEFISLNQVIELIEQHSLGQDDDGYHIINEEVFNDIFNDLSEWLYGVGLAKLAAKGYVECAWDNDQNEMVFWLSDKSQTSVPNKPSF